MWPNCGHHQHVSRKEANSLIQQDEARMIGGDGTKITSPVSMIVPTDNNRQWRNRPSGHFLGPKVRQLVRIGV